MDGIDGSDYPSPYPVDQRGALLINSIDYRRFGTDPWYAAEDQYVIFEGRKLKDGLRLGDYKIQNK
jgi:hypothetical protein